MRKEYNFSKMKKYNGFIDEIRISKQLARWTSNFEIPNITFDWMYNRFLERK